MTISISGCKRTHLFRVDISTAPDVTNLVCSFKIRDSEKITEFGMADHRRQYIDLVLHDDINGVSKSFVRSSIKQSSPSFSLDFHQLNQEGDIIDTDVFTECSVVATGYSEFSYTNTDAATIRLTIRCKLRMA